MATGHILPGYGDPVSRLRRVRSAKYPLDSKTLLEIAQNTQIEKEQIATIKQNARRLWQYPQGHETTYDNAFAERPADELMLPRPTSPTRRNKPHPPPVFLANRLHYIPGYHNPDTTVGKDAYKVDASVLPEQRELRQAMRSKYQSQQSDAMVQLYTDAFGLKQQLEPRAAQAAEAWFKIADDDDREAVANTLQRGQEDARFTEEVHGRGRPQTTAPVSMHRWMRYAGAREADAVGRITYALDTGPDQGYVPPNPYHSRPSSEKLLALRDRDILAMGNVRIQRPRPSRGDYLMHPGWPPSIYHHRIP